jgi:regulator of sigma E protease
VSAIFYFLVLVGVLIFVHEMGHYLVARLFKVKVLSFAIGFGPRAFGFKRGEEDWVVRWLPIGGYVQMLGADPTDKIPEELQNQSFQSKPLWQRALIILAGPLFNLILPIPIFFGVMLATHDKDLPPVVGQILTGAPADGVLERGDEVVAVDGDPVRYWDQLVDRISASPEVALTLTVQRGDKQIDLTVTPQRQVLRDELELSQRDIGRIGIVPSQYRSVIGLTDPQGLAALAGLKTFDEIVAVDGKPVQTYVELEQALHKSASQQPTKPIQLIVLREEPLQTDMGLIGVQDARIINLPPPTVLSTGAVTWGMDAAEMFISQVDPGSPADQAKLQRGDQVVSMDGKKFNNFFSMSDQLSKAWDSPHTLQIVRDGQPLEATIQLQKVTVIGEFKEERPVISAGFYHDSRRVQPPLRDLTFGDRFSYASRKSVTTTIDASALLVVALYRMAEGEMSRKSLGGPIMIGQMASKAGDAGFEYFLQMMAYISINLGIINLLPIPVLDGGHLMLFGIEAIKRGPLSLRTRQIASFAGMSIVVFLMLYAFKNDLERYWSDIAAWFGG